MKPQYSRPGLQDAYNAAGEGSWQHKVAAVGVQAPKSVMHDAKQRDCRVEQESAGEAGILQAHRV